MIGCYWQETIAVRRPALQNWRMPVPVRGLWGTFPESEGREQKSPWTNGRRKAMEPICSTPFFLLSLPLSFSSLLNPPTKPLLLVSDFYLVAPGSRFISQSPLSFSPDSFFLPLLLLLFLSPSLSLSPTYSPQPRTVRNFLFRISDPYARFSLPSFF